MKRHIMLCVLGGCAMLLVLGQPAAAVVYDFDNLPLRYLHGQDNWVASPATGAGFELQTTPIGGSPPPGAGKVLTSFGGTATIYGSRVNDVNWDFDLSGQSHFAIQMATSIDYTVSGYYGHGKFLIGPAGQPKVGFGINIEAWYYGVAIWDANGTKRLGSQPRPTAKNQIWDMRMEIDTTGNADEGSGRVYIRRRDDGVPAGWSQVAGLENINLKLDTMGVDMTTADKMYVESDTRILAFDNLAVIVPGTLGLRSFLDKDLNGVKDGSDEDLPGVVYSVTGPYAGTNYPNHGGTTDGTGTHTVVNGTATLGGADDGSYTAGDARPQYYYRQGAASRVLTVAPGGAVVESFGYCPELGDANVDGVVDISDFFILKTYFDQDPSVWAEGNFNEDTLVDISDFFILKGNFDAQHPDYTPPGGAAAPTPEPATLGLLALGALALLKRRRR